MDKLDFYKHWTNLYKVIVILTWPKQKEKKKFTHKFGKYQSEQGAAIWTGEGTAT